MATPSRTSETDPSFVLVDLRSGSEAAWAAVVRDLAGPLKAFLQARGVAEPEDALGEVFLDLARGIDRFEGDGLSFRKWAFTIARRRAIDQFRHRSRRPVDPVDPSELVQVMGSGGDVETVAMENLATEWAVDLLDDLTPLQRQVVSLRFIAGFGLRDVAEILDTTEGAVKASQRRALARLYRALSDSTESTSTHSAATGAR